MSWWLVVVGGWWRRVINKGVREGGEGEAEVRVRLG